jgi:hypothetical protein
MIEFNSLGMIVYNYGTVNDLKLIMIFLDNISNDEVVYRNRTVAISNADPEQSPWIKNLGFHEIAHILSVFQKFIYIFTLV